MSAVTIVGACASNTRIEGTSAPVPDVNANPDFAGALHVHDAGALTLSNVTLAGLRTPLTVVGGASASVSEAE